MHQCRLCIASQAKQLQNSVNEPPPIWTNMYKTCANHEQEEEKTGKCPGLFYDKSTWMGRCIPLGSSAKTLRPNN